jgi:hypothetical protein
MISKADSIKQQRISRRLINEHLQLLSSKEEQLQYQRNVPHVNIITELVCCWFDDAYWPDDETFCSGFSKEELLAMAEFSGVFEAVLASMQSEVADIAVYVETPQWSQLLHAAHNTLIVLQKHNDR